MIGIIAIAMRVFGDSELIFGQAGTIPSLPEPGPPIAVQLGGAAPHYRLEETRIRARGRIARRAGVPMKFYTTGCYLANRIRVTHCCWSAFLLTGLVFRGNGAVGGTRMTANNIATALGAWPITVFRSVG